MRRSSEPLWWIPFAGGMMIDSMLAPGLILITGVLLPLGLISPSGLHAALLHPVVRAGLFVFAAATFFHAAHRLKYALGDLGLKSIKPVLGFLCYGSAIVGTLIAALLALGLL